MSEVALKPLDFSNFSDGRNTTAEPLKIGKRQVQDCIDAVFVQSAFGDPSVKRSPGNLGIKSTAVFSAYMKDMAFYLQEDGTEKLLAVSGGKLYEVNASTGALTERFDLTGTGEAKIITFRDKAWVCNGTGVAKLENETAFQVGITPPSGGSSSLQAGGSLTIGTYQIIISYYRKVGGLIVLYSVGEALSNVVTTAGNQTVRATVPDPSDAQVDGAVVWMTDAGGSTFFSYKTVDNSSWPLDIDVADDTAKGADTLTYATTAQQSTRPPAFEHIFFFANRLWGSVGDDISYSLKGATVYDFERFPSKNTINEPFECRGFFSVGNDLFVNTPGGIIKHPNGDPRIAEVVITGDFFAYIKTVAKYGTGVIGLTNSGFRFFNGFSFSDVDLGRDVKKDIEKMFNANVNHRPVGIIYRRDFRTEYHLAFQDAAINTVTSNRKLILNLDALQILSNESFRAPWELWSRGASYMAVNSSGVIFNGQSVNGAGTIYKERGNESRDKFVYDSDSSGTFLTAETSKKIFIKTGRRIPMMNARIHLKTFRQLLQVTSPVAISIIMGDRRTSTSAKTSGGGAGQAKFDQAKFDVDKFSSESPQYYKRKLPMNLKGYWVEMEFSQTADDPDFNIFNTTLEGTTRKGVFV